MKTNHGRIYPQNSSHNILILSIGSEGRTNETNSGGEIVELAKACLLPTI